MMEPKSTGTRLFATLRWLAKDRLGTGQTFWRDEETSCVRFDADASRRNGDLLSEDEVAALPDVVCLQMSATDTAKGRELHGETVQYHFLAEFDLQPDFVVTVFDGEADPHILLATLGGVRIDEYQFPLIDDFFDHLISEARQSARNAARQAPRTHRPHRLNSVRVKPTTGSRHGK